LRPAATFQDRGHGKPTERIAMTFFIGRSSSLRTTIFLDTTSRPCSPLGAVCASAPFVYHGERGSRPAESSRR
jgi:hypothetical protein